MEILPVHAKINADVKADVSPAIQAVADAVHSPLKGVGKILNALVGPWVASRERVTALLRAQTEQDCKRITDGSLTYRDGNLLSMPDSSADIYTALHSLNHQADAKRLEAAVLEAVRQISDLPSEQISDEPLSQTFFNRWRREAEMIDEEELRQWWARILVEEAKKPHSISPKTLDVVKNLSRQDCVVFMRLCKGVIKNELLVTYDNKPVFGTYEDVVQLQEAGLLSHLQSAVSIRAENGESRITISFATSRIGISVATADFCIDTFSLSQTGAEMLRVLGEPVVSDAEIRTIKQHIDKVSFQETQFVDTSQNAGQWNWIRGHRPARFE